MARGVGCGGSARHRPGPPAGVKDLSPPLLGVPTADGCVPLTRHSRSGLRVMTKLHRVHRPSPTASLQDSSEGPLCPRSSPQGPLTRRRNSIPGWSREHPRPSKDIDVQGTSPEETSRAACRHRPRVNTEPEWQTSHRPTGVLARNPCSLPRIISPLHPETPKVSACRTRRRNTQAGPLMGRPAAGLGLCTRSGGPVP